MGNLDVQVPFPGQGRDIGVERPREVREVQESKFMSQNELADLARMSRVAIALLESGQVRAQYATIRKLAEALGVAPEELVAQESLEATPSRLMTLHGGALSHRPSCSKPCSHPGSRW